MSEGASWMGRHRWREPGPGASQPTRPRPPPTGSTGADTQASCRRIRRHLHRLHNLNAGSQLEGNGDSWKDNPGQRWKAQPTRPAQPTGSAGAYASRPAGSADLHRLNAGNHCTVLPKEIKSLYLPLPKGNSYTHNTQNRPGEALPPGRFFFIFSLSRQITPKIKKNPVLCV